MDRHTEEIKIAHLPVITTPPAPLSPF